MKNLEKLPSSVRSALLNRGHDDKSIALMSPREVFSEYCTWHGLINWGDDLWNNMMALQASETDNKPTDVVVWLEGGIVQGALASSPVTVSVIDYDTDGCGEDDDMIQIPQGDGTVADGFSTVMQAEVKPGRMAELCNAINDPVPSHSVKLRP